MPLPPITFVKPEELRRLFDEGRYYERARNGEFTVRMTANSHPAPAASGEPKCTRSQMLAYHDPESGERIVLLHQCRRPDGNIGGSGKPDPKVLLINGTLHVAGDP